MKGKFCKKDQDEGGRGHEQRWLGGGGDHVGNMINPYVQVREIQLVRGADKTNIRTKASFRAKLMG